MGAVMINAILTIAMLLAFLLLYGASKRWRRDGASQQMWLMVAAALVIIANVAITGNRRSRTTLIISRRGLEDAEVSLLSF
jgi:uncharacterized membrane protein YhiD involved in acid resistance